MKLLRLLPFSALLLCGCDKPEEKQASGLSSDSSPEALAKGEALAKEEATPTVEEVAAKEARIDELERDIENSTNLISDMDAFILMERAKIEDNPDYDQSFMEEALADQDEQREIIKKAQEELQNLTK